jgi:phosphoglycolate phosphatase
MPAPDASARARKPNAEQMKTPLAPLVPTIVFDLDGTLVDTVADIAAALDSVLARYGCGVTSAGEAAAMMGDGLSTFFWRALVAKRLSLPAEEAARAHQRFVAAYRRSPVRHSQVYPGIGALIEDIRGAGAHTAVCTNKIEEIAVDILVRLDLAHLFDAVVGHRGDRPMKPDPRVLLETIALAGGDRERALMVGDTGADSSAAIAARIPAVLVSYGYSPVHVRALITDFHADSVEELRDVILRFLAGAARPAQHQALRRV